jgi:hypothetical protein
MVRLRIGLMILTAGLLSLAAAAQEAAPEVRMIVVDDLPIASPELRSIAVLRGLDRDHDQYLSQEEIDAPLAVAEQSVVNAKRRNYFQHRQDTMPGSRIRNTPGYMAVRNASRSNSLTRRRASQLQEARTQMVSNGSLEISLVNPEFHRLFSRLPGEQRSALLEADVHGNNDGIVTAREFYADTRQLLSRKTQFEQDFGEAAYLQVLRLLDVLPDR